MNFFLNAKMVRKLISKALSLSILFAFLGATGCVQNGELYRPNKAINQDEARIFVYRPDAFALKGLGAIIYVDGEPIAKVLANGYAMTNVRPGAHVISERWNTNWTSLPGLRGKNITLNINVREGESAYVRLSSAGETHPSEQPNVALFLLWSLQQVSQEVALPELQACRLAKT